MLSPFALVAINHGILKVLWEDLLLGFGVATFSLCRLLARRKIEVALADWFATALGVLTLINPFLYSYFKLPIATWNNLALGGTILLIAIYQDYNDSDDSHSYSAHHSLR